MMGTAIGTIIGLPIVAQYTYTHWKSKNTFMWIAGGISTVALASATVWYIKQYGSQVFASEGHTHYDPRSKSFNAPPGPPSTSGREFLSSSRVLGLLRDNPGKIFSIQFEKRDGSIRNMTARTGVWKGPGGDEESPRVSGAGMGYNPSDYDLATVFDMEIGDYRHIAYDRVTKITVAGQTYATPSAQ